MLGETAHMQKRASRKAARGGRALLTGLARCGRCGRMMRTFYGMRSGHAHRYQCRGDDAHVGSGLCIGIGGVRVDRAVAAAILEAVSDRAWDWDCPVFVDRWGACVTTGLWLHLVRSPVRR